MIFRTLYAEHKDSEEGLGLSAPSSYTAAAVVNPIDRRAVVSSGWMEKFGANVNYGGPLKEQEPTAALSGWGAAPAANPERGESDEEEDGTDELDCLYTTWDPEGRLQLAHSTEIVNANLENMEDPMRIMLLSVGSASRQEFYVAKDAQISIPAAGVRGSTGVKYPSFNLIAKQWAQKSPMMVSLHFYTVTQMLA